MFFLQNVKTSREPTLLDSFSSNGLIKQFLQLHYTLLHFQLEILRIYKTCRHTVLKSISLFVLVWYKLKINQSN